MVRNLEKIGVLKKQYQMTDPTWIALFLPSLSETGPDINAPSHEPPAIEAVIPP